MFSKVCKIFKDMKCDTKNSKFVIWRLTVCNRFSPHVTVSHPRVTVSYPRGTVSYLRVEFQKFAASNTLQNRVSIACSPL